jgi:hypothetical protein
MLRQFVQVFERHSLRPTVPTRFAASALNTIGALELFFGITALSSDLLPQSGTREIAGRAAVPTRAN